MANNGDDGNGDGNPGTQFVTMFLCAEARAHLETKIDTMKKSIQWSIYLTSAVTGLVLILVQYYLAVIHVV